MIVNIRLIKIGIGMLLQVTMSCITDIRIPVSNFSSFIFYFNLQSMVTAWLFHFLEECPFWEDIFQIWLWLKLNKNTQITSCYCIYTEYETGKKLKSFVVWTFDFQ